MIRVCLRVSYRKSYILEPQVIPDVMACVCKSYMSSSGSVMQVCHNTLSCTTMGDSYMVSSRHVTHSRLVAAQVLLYGRHRHPGFTSRR